MLRMDRSMLSHRVTTKEPLCGHCFEKFGGMIDPRKLPCSHVFCLPCIKRDLDMRQALKCPTCKKDHSDTNVASLPKVVRVIAPHPASPLESLEEVDEEDGLTLPISLNCGICNSETVDAVSYCIDCSKKMCEKHVKFHDEYQSTFSRKSHAVITMEEYKLSPQKYAVRRCQNHPGRPIVKACEYCSRTFCDRCDVKGKCSKQGSMHAVRSMEDISSKFKDRLKSLVNSLTDKSSEASLLEQKTCIELTDIKETVDHMTDEVDRVTNEQIAVIRRKAELLKFEVENYQQECVRQVDKFVEDLGDRKEVFDDLSKAIEDLLTHSHHADIIKEYKHKMEEVEAALKLDFGFCQLPFKRMLIRTGDFKDIELQLRDSAPSTMKYRAKERKPTNVCSTICWTDNRNLLCGRYESLEVRHSGTIDTIKELKTSSVNGVSLHKQGFLALFWKDGKNYIILYSPEMEFIKLFGEFLRTSDKFSHVASSDRLVAAVDPDHRLLKMFSSSGQFLYDMKLMGVMRPWGVHFLPDGCVLITDFVAGWLKKYKVRAGNSEPVWVCRDLISPAGISTNAHGLIFVASFNAKKIYVISQQGILMKELTSQKLLQIKEIYDITVTEDQIALACGNDGVVCFQMAFDALVM